jgi:fucose permease
MRDLIRANAGLLLAGVASFVMMGAGQSLYGPALPAFSRDLGLSLPAVSWIVSMHWIGCAFGVAAMYVLGNRITPRMTVATMAVGAAMLASGLGIAAAFGGPLVFGAGYGAATVAFNPRILKAFGLHGTAMLSLLNACFGVGAILSPLVFVWLGSVPSYSFLGVTVMAIAIWLAARSPEAAEVATTPQIPGPFRPRLGLLLFAVFGIGLEASLIGLGPTALIRAGVEEARAAQLLSGFFVAFLGARVALVFVAHLAAPFTLFLAAMACTALLALGAVLVDAGSFFVLIGLPAGLYFPSFYVAGSRTLGEDPRVAPTIIAAGLVGGIPAPILLGGIMPYLGSYGFFWVMALVATGVALCAKIVRQNVPALRA